MVEKVLLLLMLCTPFGLFAFRVFFPLWIICASSCFNIDRYGVVRKIFAPISNFVTRGGYILVALALVNGWGVVSSKLHPLAFPLQFGWQEQRHIGTVPYYVLLFLPMCPFSFAKE